MKADHLTQEHLIQHRAFSRTSDIGQDRELNADTCELAAPKTLIGEFREWGDGS